MPRRIGALFLIMWTNADRGRSHSMTRSHFVPADVFAYMLPVYSQLYDPDWRKWIKLYTTNKKTLLCLWEIKCEKLKKKKKFSEPFLYDQTLTMTVDHYTCCVSEQLNCHLIGGAHILCPILSPFSSIMPARFLQGNSHKTAQRAVRSPPVFWQSRNRTPG